MNNFLKSGGWSLDAPIASDASLRRYARVSSKKQKAVFMDCTALEDPEGQVLDFVRIAGWLNESGLKAPAIYDVDSSAGYAVIEDLGDVSFTKALRGGHDRTEIYALATDVLRHLKSRPHVISLPVYKDSFIDLGRRRVIDWYVPLARKQKNREGLVQDYLQVWEKIEASLPPCPTSFMHMDFHLDNMLLLPDEVGIRRCGLIDFQDAMIGPCVYDIANLLEDARTDVPPDLKGAMLDLYVSDMSAADAEAIRLWFRVLATQFHCRWLGQLIKLALRFDKPQYLPQIPRLEGYMREALQAPVLKPLQQFFADEGIRFDDAVFDAELLAPLVAEDAY